jgi:serine/threonine protein kinase
MRPQVGQVINNKYRLIRLIGDGGMGSVYEARHELLGTTVALKFLHPELSRRSGLVQRFLQEARVSAQIQSPHVVRVIDVDQQQGGLAYIVMEYLEGRTLQTLYEDFYRAGQRLSYADALEYAMQMLEGVEAAHSAGIVHRDLKPDNVIITRDKRGEPLLKLLDFGIAKLKVTGQLDRGLTRPGVVMGTPEYMAPEQAYSADAVDLRADIFSLGVMIFEMLAGRRPVGGDEPHQIATAYMTGQVSKLTELAPGISPDLASVVHRAMAPLPKDRIQSVAEFRSALEPFVRMVKGGSLTSPATPMPGQVTPSPAVSPVASPAPLSALPLPATPATNAPDDPERRSVPKTIPPEEAERSSQEALGAPRTAMSEPPPEVAIAAAAAGAAGSDALGQATPDGVVVSQGADGRVSLNDRSSVPAQANAGMAFAATGFAPGGMPATVSAAPYMPGGGSGAMMGGGLPATVDAAPYMPQGGYPATSYDAPALGAQARPGGTAMGASPFNGTAPAYPLMPQATRGGLPGTAPMDPIAGPSPATSGRKGRESSGPSIFSILFIAAGISGLVVGGLYAAQRFMKPVEQETDTVSSAPPPPASVPADPGVASPPTGEPVPASLPTTPISQGPLKPPTTPKPTGSTTTPKPPTTGTPTAQPSTTPSINPPILPSTFPTFTIPPGFPTFTIPGPSIPRPTIPGQQPTTTNPQPSTTTTPTTPPTTTRPRINVPKFPQ